MINLSSTDDTPTQYVYEEQNIYFHYFACLFYYIKIKINYISQCVVYHFDFYVIVRKFSLDSHPVP